MRLCVSYSGRAHLGPLLLVYLIYAIIVYHYRNLGAKGLIPIVLIGIVMSWTYYTVTYATIFASAILLLFTIILKYVVRGSKGSSSFPSNMFLLLLLALSISFFIMNPFIIELAKKMGLSFETYLRSVIKTIQWHKFAQKAEQYIVEAVQYYQYHDPLMLFWKRAAQSIKFASIISLILVPTLYILTKNFRRYIHPTILLYAIMVLLISIGEKLFYRVLSVRFEPLLGFVTLAVLFAYMLSFTIRRKRTQKYLILTFTIWIVIGYIGIYLEGTKYGGVDLTLRQYIDSAASFIIGNVDYPFRFYTDMASASEAAFLAQVYHKSSLVNSFPYLNRRITEALISGDTVLLKKICGIEEVNGILFYHSSIPIRIMGAEFGPGTLIEIHRALLQQFSVLYSSNRVMLIVLRY